MTRALITGANGFVGSNLARRLCADGWEVRGLVRSTSRTGQLASLRVELATGALADAASLEAAARGVDVVFHLAGRVAAHRAEEFVRDNVEGTRNVARACAAQPTPPVLVFVSSLAAGGPGTFEAPRREADAEAPVSAYGRSKLAAESAAVEAAGDAPLAIVRPPMVFGQGDRASLQLFRSMKFLPLHPVPWLRKFPLSLVHVTDLCDALVRVFERGERVPACNNGEARGNGVAPYGTGKYYVTTDRPVTYGQLGRLAAGAAGWAVAVAPLPGAIFWCAGAIGEMMGRVRRRPTILNFDKVRETMASGWVCSDAKLRSDLGYQPTKPLEDRFDETVVWYRAHGWL
jgi:nucleoside-diphosphate-sugar epimerase